MSAAAYALSSRRVEKKTELNLWYVVIALGVILMLQAFWRENQRVEVIPYSEFRAQLSAGGIDEVVVHGDHIQGTLREARPDGRRAFVTTRVDADLAEELSKAGVKYSRELEQTFLRDLLSWILPVVVFFGLWYFFFRRIAERQGLGGAMAVGKSKAKVYLEKDTKVTFADVAGVDEAKAELREVVNFLKEPKSYGRLGARIPKGILLVGPPGTGKTLLARAVAGEAGVAFFSINGSEFVEMFVGVGAARVRDLFEQARKAAPCIIFIDELDALGRARGIGGFTGGHDEKEQTLNQLLAELDGFDPSEGVVLLAATNRPEILDPALLRAGRFDRQVLIDRPDKIGRVQILDVHLKKVALDPGVEPARIAELTAGFSGADLANLVNEAAIVATRRGADTVAMDDFTAAVERIVAGLEKRNRVMSPFERRVIAFHEMGHALAALSIPGCDPVHKVSIIPRGIGALGYTIQRPTEDRFLMTRAELDNKMTVLLGGRAAEALVFDELSTGAADDLAKASDIARTMVMRYGMDAALGHVAYESEPMPFLGQVPGWGAGPRRYSEATADAIDRAVRESVGRAFTRAGTILKERRALLDRAAEALLAKETLSGEDLTGMVAAHGKTVATGGV